MSGYVVSSSERHSGQVEVRVDLAPDAHPGALELVEARVRAFAKGLEAGFFFPGTLIGPAPEPSRCGALSLGLRLQVVDFPRTALAVLGGALTNCHHHDVSFRAATAVAGHDVRNLLVETGARPAAAAEPPFVVELPDDLGGNDALLVEVEFARDVPADIGAQLLVELGLWEVLALAYPIDPDEGTKVGGAQRHFNDPRTIHHHEWICDADPAAWNLLVNLCCAWTQRERVVRLHIE